MKTKIETSGGKGVISGEEMESGDFGVVVSDGCDTCMGHLVWCRGYPPTRVIVDCIDSGVCWVYGDTITVRLIAVGETITITRTE